MASRTFNVAILGAATAAGRELGTALVERGFPLGELLLFDGGDAVGEVVEVGDEEYTIAEARANALRGCELILIAPGADLPPAFVEELRELGAAVIDGSLRTHGGGSLLVFPGINDEEIEELESAKGLVFSLPSPSAAQLASVLLPLEAKAGVARAEVVCLETVSAIGGIPGMEELSQQTISLLSGKEPESATFAHRIAFNVIPQVQGFEASGETSHERRVAAELCRLLDRESLPLSITSVLVPVFYGAMQILTVATERPLDAAAARAALEGGELKILDEPGEGVFPMPMLAVGDEAVQVGRIRDTGAGLGMISVADALQWGTVVPMVRIAERLVEEGLL